MTKEIKVCLLYKNPWKNIIFYQISSIYEFNCTLFISSVTWMNRIQNQSVISECRETESTWTCVGVFYQEQKNGWIEIMAPPVYNDKGV